jgi:UDP-glucose 4-epimerase
MLSLTKEKFPPLKQTLFRVSTILGRNTKNQITDLFEKPFLIGIRGSKSPFVFIWDEDLVEIFTQAILLGKTGIYNAAGDGAMSVDEIAQVLQKRVIWFSATLLGSLLWVLHRLGLSQYDHEQVRFLQYRPVLSNDKLKGEFGYRPKKSSRETFLFWKASRSRS